MPRTIVTIHGTGKTEQGFWIPRRHALTRHVDQPRLVPVWWGDLIDAGARLPRLAARISARLRWLAGGAARPAARARTRGADRVHDLVNGVAGVLAYFLPWRQRQRRIIQNRLRATLAELTEQGHEIVLVSESLGCLIAFDVLHAEAHRFNLAAWITLGCPLRTLVRTRQRGADLGAITPQTVRRWLNVYAPLDLIAAPIAATFPAYPIHDERLEGARSRLAAHDYWPDARVVALIARQAQA